MELTLEKGRWASSKTARLYITDAVAEAVSLSLTASQISLLELCVHQLHVDFSES